MSTQTPVTAAKAWAAAIGTTLTAITTALATASVALGDDTIDLQEVSAMVTAFITMAATIYGVWRTENKPKNPVTRENTWN